MSEELTLLPCPFCGSRDVEVQGKPAILDALDSVCCNECTADAPHPVWNTRAQLPSQGGEAVEVVGVVCVSRFKNNPAMENVEFHQSADIPPGQHDLMAVAQHQRILAAATHPADQVAEPDAELVELLRSKFPRIDPCQPVPLDEKAHCCEYTIYVERERLHRIIDAKMASLEVKS